MSMHFGIETGSEGRKSRERSLGIGFMLWRWWIFIGWTNRVD